MSITLSFDAPYFEGAAAVTGEVPGKFSVALGGHTYVIDTEKEWGRRSIQLLRQQADQSARPGEASINPDDLWRRSFVSWHHGAGQSWADRDDSDPFRYRTSKGVDPWTKWQIANLPATDQKRSSANTNLELAVAGSYLYVSDGQEVRSTQDITVDSPTWALPTGIPAASILSLTSDGYYVYFTDGSNVYRFVRGTGAVGAAWDTLDCTLLRWVKGRLMAAKDDAIYNITAPPTATPLTVAAGTVTSDWEWVDFAAGSSVIYAAGYQGDKSLIFRIGIKDDASGLDVAVQAGELPDGEIVRSLGAYLGFLLVGTDKGVRFAIPEAGGDLTIGPLIETPAAVRCFEGQDRFVWYGLSNYDAVSTGLGRLDLSTIGEDGLKPGTPAYAADLMVTGQGAVTSVKTFGGLRVFAVSGLGVYAETTSLVADASLDSGDVGFGLADPKVSMFCDSRHELLTVGEVEVLLAVDGGGFDSLGSNTAGTGKTYPTGERRGERFELRHVLTNATVTSATLQAYPAPARRGRFKLPLLIHESVDPPRGNTPVPLRPQAEVDYVIGLAEAGNPTTLQVGAQTFACVVEDYDDQIGAPIRGGRDFNRTLTVDVKLLASL